VAGVLVHRYLPKDRPSGAGARKGFDVVGTAFLVVSLAAYALAMTTGRGYFGSFNAALLAVAVVAAGVFTFVESRVAVPLVRLALLRDRGLRGSLIASGLVSTVMMTTLVVGTFYLSRSLGLNSAQVGAVMSLGPLVSALTGVPAGRLADRWGAHRVTVMGLGGIASGSVLLAGLPTSFGVVGYVAPIVLLTLSYGLFQTANNASVMRHASADQRGVVSGLLNVSRNLGLITGASAMGAVFAFASRTADITRAEPAAVATGMRTTFAVAGFLMMAALAVNVGKRDEGPSMV